MDVVHPKHVFVNSKLCASTSKLKLYNNQISARALIGQLAVGYCADNPRKNRASSELLCKNCGSWFTNSSRVLRTNTPCGLSAYKP